MRRQSLNSLFKNKIKSKRAETLLEMVMSIALFAITILMTATMFVAANNLSRKNHDMVQAMDQAITDIITETNVNESEEIAVNFRLSNGTVINKKVKFMGTDGIYKYK